MTRAYVCMKISEYPPPPRELFTLSEYTSSVGGGGGTTRGHSLKLFKRRSRLKIRSNSFSNRVVDTWNSLQEQIVQAPSLNCFKSRLNNWWKHHLFKLDSRPNYHLVYTNDPNAFGRGRDA